MLGILETFADGRGGYQDFHGRHPAVAVFPRQKFLRNYGPHRLGEPHSPKITLCAGDGRDDPLDSGDHVGCGDRPDHQAARLRCLQSGVDGGSVGHISQHYHVRILAECCAEANCQLFGIHSNLALGNRAAQVAMQELNRVLDGDNVLMKSSIDVMHHGSHGGALPHPLPPVTNTIPLSDSAMA